MSQNRTAVYPGSFDPPTLGHMDVLQRAAPLFDRVVVGVLENPEKQPLLALAERVALLQREIATAGLADRVDVDVFGGLAVHFAQSVGAAWILRGVRSAGDVEYELPMAASNRAFSSSGVETLFLPSHPGLSHIRGTLVRQVARGGGELTPFVSPAVAAVLREAAERKRK